MSSNDLPDINQNIKCCLLTDSLNENNKALKTTLIAPTKTHILQCLTASSSTQLFTNKGNINTGFTQRNTPSSNYYGYFYLWSNTAISGVGLITVNGLDNDYNELSEIIELNSVNNGTPVQTVNQYRWVNSIISQDRGGNTSVEIYCAYTSGVAGNIVCSQTFYTNYNAFFMVPRGYIARLTSLDYGGTATNTFSLLKWIKTNSNSWDPQSICYFSSIPVGASRIYSNGGGIGEFTEGEIVLWGQVSTASTTSNITSVFTLYPVANYQ